jgi:hypothetical protein
VLGKAEAYVERRYDPGDRTPNSPEPAAARRSTASTLAVKLTQVGSAFRPALLLRVLTEPLLPAQFQAAALSFSGKPTRIGVAQPPSLASLGDLSCGFVGGRRYTDQVPEIALKARSATAKQRL